MNTIYQNRLHLPITTGTPTLTYHEKPSIQPNAEPTPSFREILENQLTKSSSLSFSKHAVTRAAERNVDLSTENIMRLHEGVKIAEEKGLNDTLILVDKIAFIVNIRNNTVVTTVNGDDLKGNVFTNIDGTVII